MEKQIEDMAIENLAAFLWHNTNMYDEDLIFDVAEALCKAGYRKQSESEWISVEDRLPEPQKSLLVYVCMDGEWQIREGWYGEMTKLFFVLAGYPYRTDATVTHWMPLPEPPKGGAE